MHQKSISIDSTFIIRLPLALLRMMKEKGGSDLFLTAGFAPAIKFSGKLTPVSTQALSPDDAAAMVQAVMNERQRVEFDIAKECNFAISPDDIGRFRVSAFVQQAKAGMVLRTITTDIPELDALHVPQVLKEVVMAKRGLVIMVGATGSGKSTTLAAMIGHRNANSHGHIITIEDPIEFVHASDQCLITQREIGAHSQSFSHALRAALREDPDVILVGELRDLETIRLALTAAETGHLVLASLHTRSAAATVDRMVDVFDGHEKAVVRTQLSDALVGVVSQALCPTLTSNGRVAVFETLVATPAIRHLIREGKTAQMQSTQQTGAAYGMQSMAQALQDARHQGLIA